MTSCSVGRGVTGNDLVSCQPAASSSGRGRGDETEMEGGIPCQGISQSPSAPGNGPQVVVDSVEAFLYRVLELRHGEASRVGIWRCNVLLDGEGNMGGGGCSP